MVAIRAASLDLRVYPSGGGAWLDVLPIYVEYFGVSLGGPDLPFSYPPAAFPVSRA